MDFRYRLNRFLFPGSRQRMAMIMACCIILLYCFLFNLVWFQYN